jgi:hypothetical protein
VAVRANPAGKAHIRIANPLDEELTVILEPWGETHAIAPHSSLDVPGSGPPGDTLQVSFAEGSAIVWGWPGSIVRVVSNEIPPVEPRRKTPVPGG